jgi:hypothetical protein
MQVAEIYKSNNCHVGLRLKIRELRNRIGAIR